MATATQKKVDVLSVANVALFGAVIAVALGCFNGYRVRGIIQQLRGMATGMTEMPAEPDDHMVITVKGGDLGVDGEVRFHRPCPREPQQPIQTLPPLPPQQPEPAPAPPQETGGGNTLILVPVPMPRYCPSSHGWHSVPPSQR